MSRYFLSLAFISWLTPLVGQSGFPFPTDQAEWHVTKVTPILGPNDAFDQWMYWVNGDTLIVDSIAYSAVYARGTCHSDQTTSFQYQPYSPAQYARIGGLRQQGDSIFFRRLPFPGFKGAPSNVYNYPLNQEVLLYDFSLQVGDTIAYVTPDRKFVVESVAIISQGRKEIKLSSNGCGLPINVIWREGQGCTSGLLETICFYYYAGSCFYNEAIGEVLCALPCAPEDAELVKTDSPIQPGDIRIFPNPSSGPVTIDFGSIKLPLRLEVRDVFGRLLHQEVVQSTPWSLEGISAMPGIYSVIINGEDGQRWSSRLVIHK